MEYDIVTLNQWHTNEPNEDCFALVNKEAHNG